MRNDSSNIFEKNFETIHQQEDNWEMKRFEKPGEKKFL